jgi:hypothetical protein
MPLQLLMPGQLLQQPLQVQGLPSARQHLLLHSWCGRCFRLQCQQMPLHLRLLSLLLL